MDDYTCWTVNDICRGLDVFRDDHNEQILDLGSPVSLIAAKEGDRLLSCSY